MADLTSNLIVRLIDGVSGPASAAGRAIRGMRSAVAATSGRIATAQADVRTAIEANAQRMDVMRGRMVDAAAGAYVLTRAISAPISAAMDFESAMADVRKVVDFDTPAAFKQFQTDVIAMSKRLPVAASDLTAIVAAAGQAGIASEDLLRFTEMAAKVGVAFDISSDMAGDSLAKMMTGLGLTIEEVSALTDAMNHLSNSQASSAADILDVVRRVGATAKQYGFTAEQVSAFASAMLSAGAESDVASTSFRNMGRALTRGASATDRQQGAFQQLGLTSEDVAKRMQEDAVATTMDVLERIGKLPAEIQAAVSSDLFGDEARALGPLLTNLDLLRTSLGLVADETKYLGSAQREYNARADTSANQVQLFKNNLTALNIAIGNTLLPGLNSLMAALTPIANAFERLATEFPGLTSGVISLATGLIGLRIAAIGAGYAGLLLKGGFLASLLPILSVAKGITAVGRGAGKLTAPLRGVSRVFGRELAPSSLASVAGMTLVDQSLSRTAKASKAASDIMVKGMSAARVANASASAAMIAGMSGVTAAAGRSGGIARAFRNVGPAMLALLNPINVLKGAMRGLLATTRFVATGMKLALVSTGIGAALVAIGAAAAWVANNWEGIGVAFEAFKGAFDRAIAPVRPALEPVLAAFRDLADVWDALTGKVDADNGKWAAWGVTVGTSVGEAVRDLTENVRSLSGVFDGLGTAIGDFVGLYQQFTSLLPQHFTIFGLAKETFLSLGRSLDNVSKSIDGIITSLGNLASELGASGSNAIQSMLDAMMAKFEELLTWVRKIPGRIADAIGNIDLSGIIKWPKPPAWLGGAMGADKAEPSVSGGSEFPAEARAKGGPVRAGQTYLVGEEGPELFKPRQSGQIVPNGQFQPPESVFASMARPTPPASGPSKSVSIGDIVVHVTSQAVDRPADLGRQIGEAIRRRLDGEFADVFA